MTHRSIHSGTVFKVPRRYQIHFTCSSRCPNQWNSKPRFSLLPCIRYGSWDIELKQPQGKGSLQGRGETWQERGKWVDKRDYNRGRGRDIFYFQPQTRNYHMPPPPILVIESVHFSFSVSSDVVGCWFSQIHVSSHLLEGTGIHDII